VSYLNCRHGDPCEDCNGYVGPLDTYACLCRCHDEPTATRAAARAGTDRERQEGQ
jgi:hypothetical protein